MSVSVKAQKDPRDKWIPVYFVMFFTVIAILDSIFVYIAVTTQTGVITKHPYEKGLAYNETLAKAKSQPKLIQKAVYEDGILRWQLADRDAVALLNVDVRAKIIRSVQDGYDFDIAFKHIGGGIYEARPSLPLKGIWLAKLSGKWDSKQYQTTLEFMAK